jgi:ligand-binding SRPBCC domain-containing protein
MRLERFAAVQRLAVGLEEAWAFFSDPRNLAVITPPWLDFRILSPLPPRMHPGMIVEYTVRPFGGVPVRWVTEITHVVEPVLFVDEQRFGPYRFWHHQHHFRPCDGGVEMEDVVHYALPGRLAGRALAGALVRRRVAAIFAYRRRVLAERFGEPPARST